MVSFVKLIMLDCGMKDQPVSALKQFSLTGLEVGVISTDICFEYS